MGISGTDLYIIAAGNGSRLDASVPKALVPVVGEPCLTTTLRRVGLKFRRIIVGTNINVHDQWDRYFNDLRATYPELAKLVLNLPIKSGLGDGHATLQVILAAERIEEATLPQDIVIAWGDVFFPTHEIIDELLSLSPEGSGLIPVIHQSDPYVSLLVDERRRCIAADFSKHGEHHATGLHDQSVFRFNRSRLRESLCGLHNCLWKNGRYLTPAGELSLLYSLHQLYNSGDPAYVYETEFPTLSFNTIEEVVAIQRNTGQSITNTVTIARSQTAPESATVPISRTVYRGKKIGNPTGISSEELPLTQFSAGR